ncbi:MAG TPA: alpha-amylase family glycosyl hydrolase [Pseudonocardia sp.]
MTEPDWVQHAIFWQVYPLGFVGAAGASGPEAAGASGPDGRPAPAGAGRLDRLTDWLDYAVRLGASGLALGPVFASATHGYDTTDHYTIDPRLGDRADFDALLEAAHSRGLRVLLDGVFNHVGHGFEKFRLALEGGPGSPEARWFRISWADGGEPDWATFEGHRELVAFNHDEPRVADYVTDVMCHWLAAGADGWRLDAAYAVPTSFWADVLGRVRAAHPDVYLVGEVIHGDYVGTVKATGMHAVTQYELWKAVWSSINDGNLFELAWALGRHDEFLDSFVPLTFVGNHDVSRVASVLDDERHLPHALALLFTLGGTPCVYYGDEQAFRGVKEERAGGDDAVRPEFPADENSLAPFGWPTYRLHQELIGLRRRHPWLHHARSGQLHLTNTQLVLVAEHDGSRVLTALSMDDDPAELPAPGAGEVLAGEAELLDPGREDTRVLLPAHGWAVLG